MREILWKLTPGTMPFQETELEKLKAGEDYIKKLKKEGEKVLEVKKEDGFLKIILEDVI